MNFKFDQKNERTVFHAQGDETYKRRAGSVEELLPQVNEEERIRLIGLSNYPETGQRGIVVQGMRR